MIQHRTKNYSWEYEPCGKGPDIGIISIEDHQQMISAIESGEYKPNAGDPNTWVASWPNSGAMRNMRFLKENDNE